MLLLYISNFFSNCLGNLGVEFQHNYITIEERQDGTVCEYPWSWQWQSSTINPRQPTFQFLRKAEDLSTKIGEFVRAAGIKQHHFKLPNSYNV